MTPTLPQTSDAQRQNELSSLTHALRQHLEWQQELGADGCPHPEPAERRELDAMISAAQRRALSQASNDPPQAASTHDTAPRPDGARPALKLNDVESPQLEAQDNGDSIIGGHIYKFAQLSSDHGHSSPAHQTTRSPNDQKSLAGDLSELKTMWDNCQRCQLCQSRRNVVFGTGPENADLMIVGEAPGINEDRQGRPFVGKAGELLDRMLHAMTLSRDQVYLCHLIKCRPPGNRAPRPEEIDACRPLLRRQFQLIKPKIVVALGETSTQILLNSQSPFSSLRGQWQSFGPARVMPTFHLDHILRNPADKRFVWQDLQNVMSALSLSRA